MCSLKKYPFSFLFHHSFKNQAIGCLFFVCLFLELCYILNFYLKIILKNLFLT